MDNWRDEQIVETSSKDVRSYSNDESTLNTQQSDQQGLFSGEREMGSQNSAINEKTNDDESQAIEQEGKPPSHYSSGKMTPDTQITDGQARETSSVSAKDIDVNEINPNQESSGNHQLALDSPTAPLQQKNGIERDLPLEHILELHHAQGGFGNNFYGVISSFAIAALMNYTLTCKYYSVGNE